VIARVLVALALAVAGCGGVKEIELDVTFDVGCHTEVDTIDVMVTTTPPSSLNASNSFQLTNGHRRAALLLPAATTSATFDARALVGGRALASTRQVVSVAGDASPTVAISTGNCAPPGHIDFCGGDQADDNMAGVVFVPPVNAMPGDVLLVAVQTYSGTNSVAPPLNNGWQKLLDGFQPVDNSVTLYLAIYGKVADASDTPSGGLYVFTVQGAASAAIACFRGASLALDGTSGSTFDDTSGGTYQLPTVSASGPDDVLLVAAAKMVDSPMTTWTASSPALSSFVRDTGPVVLFYGPATDGASDYGSLQVPKETHASAVLQIATLKPQ